MQTIEIQKGIQVGVEDILRSIRQFDNQTLTSFAGAVNRVVAQRRAVARPPASREAELLRKIREKIPASLKNREKQLYVRLQNGEISRQEKTELDLLLGKMEELAAERILLVGELARLRGISVQQLVAELKQKPRHGQKIAFPA